MTNTAQIQDRPLLRVQDLSKLFPVSSGGWFERDRSFIHAVDGVGFELGRGESFGLVGESGCGKTTTGKLLVRLTDPTEGHIIFDYGEGEATDIATLKGKSLKAFRRQAQMIFQDPYESMNPRRTIFDTVAEPLRTQKIGSPLERIDRVARMLEMVGLTPPRSFMFRHPHELSGGQRQRVAIARALIMRPEVVICDEPTSALDVSVQSQILNLLQDLKEEFGLTYLLISHNLAVVQHMADRVAVMYLGRIVEEADSETLFNDPRHPYTRALLGSVLTPDPRLGVPDTHLGAVFPNPIDPPPGCTFHPRCPDCMTICRSEPPQPAVDGGHNTECHLYGGGVTPRTATQ